jgi:hypothetical protein
MHDHLVVVLYDNSKLILINSEMWTEEDRIECDNQMPNVSITPISLIKGFFIIIGSKIQLYKIQKVKEKLKVVRIA